MAGVSKSRGNFFKELLKARLYPFELSEELVKLCTEYINYCLSESKTYQLRYRYDNSGKIVPLTKDQPTEGDYTSGVNPTKAHPIEEQTTKESAVETLPVPEDWSRIDQLYADIQLEEQYLEELDENILAIKAITQPLPDEKLGYTLGTISDNGMPKDHVFYLTRMAEKQDKFGFLSEELHAQILLMYAKTFYAYEIDAAYKFIESNKLKRNSKKRDVRERAEEEFEKQSKKIDNLTKNILAILNNPEPPPVSHMCQEINKFVAARKAVLDWQPYIDNYEYEKEITKQNIEHMRLEIEQIKSKPEPPQEWGDEELVILEPRSREMTQVERRTRQGNHKAQFYFGVNDDGTLTKATLKQQVLNFFLQFIQELVQEEGYSHDVTFLTAEEFLDEQSTFPQKEEVETGSIEYKSTGGHKTTPVQTKITTPENWRVIKVEIRSSEGAKITREKKLLKQVESFLWPQPPLIQKEEWVEEDTPICSVSRYRDPCYKQPGWKDLSEKEQDRLRGEDREQIEKYVNLGRTLQAVTTALILARQVYPKHSLRTIDLERERDILFLDTLRNIQRRIIRMWEREGQDETNDKLKQLCARLRVYWQEGRSRTDNNSELEYLFLQALDLTDPIHNNDYIEILSPTFKWEIPSYGLCTVATLGRALPPPTMKRAAEETRATFERFRQRNKLSDEKISQIKEWAKEFYQNMREPSTIPPKNPGSSGSLERSRSQGGQQSFISDLYSLVIGTPDLSFLPNTKGWREKWNKLEPLGSGNIADHQMANGEFAYAISLDIMQPYLDHTEVCKGIECKDVKSHPLLIPFGIPERGHKTRVPCLGSLFLSILQQPIRSAMFGEIRRDPRCAYRAKGGDQAKLVSKFLQTMEEADLIHSGDLRVSTDNFSIDFNWAIIDALYEIGKLTREEWKIARCATGPYRMFDPIQTTGLSQLQPNISYEEPFEMPMPIDERIRKMVPKGILRKTLLEPRVDVEYKKIEIPKRKTPETCINCGSTKDFPECYKITTLEGPESLLSRLEWYKKPLGERTERINYPHHIFPKKLSTNPLPGFVRGSRMKEKQNKTAKFPQNEGEGLGYIPYQPDSVDHEEQLKAMVAKCYWLYNVFPAGTGYLTQKGLQMSQPMSIALLYSFNLYADTVALKAAGARGKSLLCGDDSLRAGNAKYIQEYRREVESLGGIWSSTKDVIGTKGHGIFTEQHFVEGRIFQIPKVRSIARYQLDEVPGWVKAIRSSRKVEFPDEPEIRRQGVEELLSPFEEQINYLARFLPVGVHEDLGGVGDLKRYPLHWAAEEIFSAIKVIPDKQQAISFAKKFTKCLHPQQNLQKRSGKVKLAIDYPTEASNKLNRELGYYRGTHRWLYLELKHLRSALEGATSLTSPPIPARNQILDDRATILSYINQLRNIRDELINENLFPGPIDTSTEEQFIKRCHKYDVPRHFVRDAIGEIGQKPYGFKDQSSS
jgi:hypothetical protein